LELHFYFKSTPAAQDEFVSLLLVLKTKKRKNKKQSNNSFFTFFGVQKF